MTGARGLAIVLFAAACAPIAAACGVSEGGLGAAAVDAAGTGIGGDAGFQQDGGPGTPDDGASGLDAIPPGQGAAQGDAPQDDAAQPGATLGEGGPAEAGLDGGQVGDAASGVDGSPDTGGGGGGGQADASPDAGTTCDFSGTWGSRLVIDVGWSPQGITGIVLASGSGTITQWLLSTRNLSGNTSTESALVCGIDLPDFDGTAIAGGEVYGVRFPSSLFDNNYIPPFAVHGTFGGSSPGSTYDTTPSAVLLGLTLSSPTTAVWPATITTEVDMDKDGKPGVTANTLQGGGYTHPPVDIFETNRADQLYLAIRQVTALTATATDCDHLSGTVSIPTISDSSNGTSKAAIDSHVIGCRIAGTATDAGTGTDCTSSQASFVDNTQPVFSPKGGSSFTSLRMPSGSTCAAVRMALQ